MGLFDFLKGKDINEGLGQCEATAGAVLLDVRTQQEYASGRIPGSKNIPLDAITKAGSVIKIHRCLSTVSAVREAARRFHI